VNHSACTKLRRRLWRLGFDGTWIMCKDPHSDKVMPIYSEPQLVCAPWKLTDEKSPDGVTTGECAMTMKTLIDTVADRTGQGAHRGNGRDRLRGDAGYT
jgi:hypothetical protein